MGECTFVSHVATDNSFVSTDELSVATCVTNVTIDESSVVVHPWITLTEEELQMPYLITLGLVETIFDPVVDRVKMVLVGATIIKRERVPIEVSNKLVVFDVDDGVDIDYCAGVGAAAAGVGTGQQEGATSCRQCCGFLCEK
ncbi:hypothetical protein EJD97_004401, partial [Solanum chilense]